MSKAGWQQRIPRDGDRISIFGRSGMGKTTIVARALPRDVLHDGRLCLIFDAQGDVQKYLMGKSAVSEKPLLPSEIVRVVATAEEAIQLGTGRQGLFGGIRTTRVFFLPGKGPNVPRGELAKRASQFRAAVNDERTAGWVLVGDEAEVIYPNRGQDTDDALEGLKFVRNRRQRLYLMGQRPQWLSTMARANTEHVCLFRSDSRKFITDGCGEWGDVEDFEIVSELTKHEYLYRGPMSDPPYETLDSLEDALPWQ